MTTILICADELNVDNKIIMDNDNRVWSIFSLSILPTGDVRVIMFRYHSYYQRDYYVERVYLPSAIVRVEL